MPAARSVLAEGLAVPAEGPPLWDGHAGERIAAIVEAWLASGVTAQRVAEGVSRPECSSRNGFAMRPLWSSAQTTWRGILSDGPRSLIAILSQLERPTRNLKPVHVCGAAGFGRRAECPGSPGARHSRPPCSPGNGFAMRPLWSSAQTTWRGILGNGRRSLIGIPFHGTAWRAASRPRPVPAILSPEPTDLEGS